MRSALVLMVVLVVLNDVDSEEVKCCGTDEVLVKIGNEFKCRKDFTERYQIYTKYTGGLNDTKVSSCVDSFNGNFVTYNIQNNEITTGTNKYFPKCCPLNRIYHTKLHACIETPTPNLTYLNETFLKVGLLSCRIIEDIHLEEVTDDTINMIELEKRYYRKPSVDLESFCFDRTERENFILRECQESLETCDKFKCVKKCCPDGQSFVNGPYCMDTYQHGLNLSMLKEFVEGYEDDYVIIYNRTCEKRYQMSSNITLHKNGSFTEWLPKYHITDDVKNLDSYCIEHTLYSYNQSGYYFFYCFPSYSKESNKEFTKFQIRVWPFILSCIFLLLTIAVYVVIKEYKKMFGKILINYCLTSFLLFMILLWDQLSQRSTPIDCLIRGYVLIFLALAEFFWANVMNFEIWCTFGTTKMYLGNKHKKMQLRKYIYYNLYAWGAPLLLTLVILLFQEWKVLPEVIQPYLGNKKCFFDNKEDNYAKFLFFNTPLLVIQIVNMMFFIKTVIYYVHIKNEINKVNDAKKNYSCRKYQHDRERFLLIVKLSIVMGITFIFEVVTGFFNMSKMGTTYKYLEIVFDIYNALQGVFIFIIFICKRRIVQSCLQKLNIHVPHDTNSASTRTQSSLTLSGVVLNNFSSKDKLNSIKL